MTDSYMLVVGKEFELKHIMNGIMKKRVTEDSNVLWRRKRSCEEGKEFV